MVLTIPLQELYSFHSAQQLVVHNYAPTHGNHLGFMVLLASAGLLVRRAAGEKRQSSPDGDVMTVV